MELSKTFPGTRALIDVDLDIRAGEVHALVGHNGSGKSTLIKVLAGYHHPDSGASVFLDGHPTTFEALGRGTRLSFVHQDLGLVLELDTIDNLALHGGFARNSIGGIKWSEQARRAHQLMAPFAVDFDITAPLSQATPVERTIVAIAGALQGWSSEGGVLVLDEPTAVLPHNEVDRLFDIVRRLRASGAGILYVSHRLDEVFELADRVSVLRGGVKVATNDVRELNKQRLVELMLGTEARADYRAELPGAAPAIEPLLAVHNLSGHFLQGIDFVVRPGDVLGIAGLPADGRDELPRLITDAHQQATSGTVRVSGSPSDVDVRAWDGSGVALLPPDRAKLGILGPMSVGENISLSTLERFGSTMRLDHKAERAFVRRWIDRLSVKTTGPDAPITTLSGGNQQKVLFGRTLAIEPKVLVLCEPTAGVDIGARQAIYELVAEQVRQGLGVVIASSDIGDLTALCTRVIVLQRGHITSELSGDKLTEHDILNAMEGLERGAPV